MYSISPFVLGRAGAGEDYRLFAAFGEASIVDANLAAAMHEIAAMQRCVEGREIKQVFERHGLPVEATRRFLRRIHILRLLKVQEDVVVFSKSSEFCRAITDCVACNDAFRWSSTSDIGRIGRPRLLIAIQEMYSPDFVRDLYSWCVDNPDCIVLHAYFVFRHFVIDGFYCLSLGTPDHFEGLRKLAGCERQRALKPTSWVDFFLDDHGSVGTSPIPTFKASSIEISSALYLLYIRFRSMAGQGAASRLPDDFATTIEMNLDSGHIDRH